MNLLVVNPIISAVSNNMEIPNRPEVIFKIKSDLSYVKLMYKNHSIDTIVNIAMNNFHDINRQIKRNESNIELEGTIMWQDFSHVYYSEDENKIDFVNILLKQILIWDRVNNIQLTDDDVKDCSDYIMSDWDNIIQKNISIENHFIENIKNTEQFLLFKKQHIFLLPIIDKLFNSNKVLANYGIHYHNIMEKYYEKRGNMKSFAPGGMCYYNSHIYLNTDNMKSPQEYGKIWNKRFVTNILLHELGHAIDWEYRNDNKIMLGDKKSNKRIINSQNFTKYTKIAYKRSRKYNKENRKIVAYNTHPKIVLNRNKAKIIYNWDRANSENFAESFAIISNWLINGFSQVESFTIHSGESNKRLQIKILMKTLQYLLKNCNWEYLGVPSNLMSKRKNLIKQLLNKIDKMPDCLKGKKITSKVHTYKKFSRMDVVR